MKVVLLLIVFNVTLLGGPTFNWSEETRRIETEQVSLWEKKLISAKENKPLQRVADLSLGLRNMGYRKRFAGHSPAVDAIYGDIQTEILSIPGHANYFANEIAREQKSVESYPTNTGPRVSYDFQRALYFEILSHLPSPETIAVLGHFLSDDKDTPVSLESPGSDWGENPRANSYFSSSTIMSIGLRNPPVEPARHDDNPDTRLAETRAWWGKVKSGKRSFSFKGQKVEYRFKPDGTWETITMANPPDDGPGRPEAGAAQRPTRRSESVVPGTNAPSSARPWPWILMATMVLLGVIIWRAMRSCSA